MSDPDVVAAIAPSDRARLLRKTVIVCGSILGLLWLFGAVRFLRADGVLSMTLPRREQPPRVEHNVASYRFGPTLRASSYYRDPVAQHHPMFLVDEHDGSATEKWASAPRDRKPWVEISWREPRSISRVVVHHAGVLEQAGWTLRDYRLRCLFDGRVGPALEVRGNQSPVTEHAFRCEGARGLRSEWTPNAEGDVVRVFEVQVWGR